MVGSCYLIRSANLYLLIVEFNPFVFKVITDGEGLDFYPFVFCFLCMSFGFLDPHFLNYCLCLCFVDFFVVTCFDSFLISSCVYSVDIFFVVTMGVTYNILKLKQSNLNDTNLTSVAYKSSIPIQLCLPPLLLSQMTSLCIVQP